MTPPATPAGSAQERATRAVIFCDVVSSTETRERLGDIEADALFADLAHRIEDAVGAAEGVVVKWLGDGAMAVFTSAAAALDAAVSLQQRAHDHRGADTAPDTAAETGPTQLRVGVSIGDVSRSEGDWFGMPVVQAARLCAAAQPDEILAADIVRVLAGSRAEHAMSPAGDYTLKGISEPVATVRVAWEPLRRSTAADFPALLASARRGPFVGRTLVVTELLEEWKSGTWRALMVGGESGIGKTRLVAELSHVLHGSGATVVAGRCDEELAVSYRPWAEAIAPLIDALSSDDLLTLADEHVAELRRLVPAKSGRLGPARPAGSAGPPLGDADSRHAMLVDGVLAVLGASGPVVVVLDDLHWVDQRSLQLVRHVLDAELPTVTVIGTYRDTDLDPAHRLTSALADFRRIDGVRRLTLSGLDDHAVAEFFEFSAGRALDDHERLLAHQVHARTTGNPLFIGEILGHLVNAQGFAALDESGTIGPDGMVVPDGLREVIARRLRRLGDEIEATLRIAATIGHSFDPDIVERVTFRRGGPDSDQADSSPDVLAHLEEAQTNGIVIDTGELFEFRHAVIREVLVAEMSTTRRRRLHRELATVMEDRWALSLDQHLGQIAYHHVQGLTPAAAAWCLRAAQTAADSLDTGAVELADQGLAMLEFAEEPDPTLRCDLLIVRATGMRLTGVETIEDARAAFEAAAAIGDQGRMGEALLAVSVRSTAEAQTDHITFLSEGLSHLTDDSLITRWAAEMALVVRKYLDNKSDPAEQIAEAERITAHLDPDDTRACQIAMRCARSLTSTNQPRPAEPIAARFLANCAGVDTEGFPVEVGLSTMWLHLGDRTASDRYLDAAVNDRRRSYWFFNCQVLQRQAMRALLDGRWADAAEAIAEVQRIGGHDPNLVLSCAAQTRWLQLETGDTTATYGTLREYESAMPDFPVLRAMLASDSAEAGFTDEARTRLDQLAPDDFLAAGRGWIALWSLSSLAWAAITIDAEHHAATLVRLLLPYSGQIAVMATGTHVVGAVDRLHAGLAGLQGDHELADRLFADALAQERRLHAPPLEARTLHWWGRALQRRGDSERAAPLLAQARSAAVELGMGKVVEQIDDLFTRARSVFPLDG